MLRPKVEAYWLLRVTGYLVLLLAYRARITIMRVMSLLIMVVFMRRQYVAVRAAESVADRWRQWRQRPPRHVELRQTP